jgi:hypothetical protein
MIALLIVFPAIKKVALQLELGARPDRAIYFPELLKACIPIKPA